MTKRTAHTIALAKAVAKNFMRAGFTAQDLLSGQILLTELPWQNPPLIAPDPLDGYPFHDYINYSVKVQPEQLYRFWRWALVSLYSSVPSTVALTGWRGLMQALPSESAGEKLLRFSVPEKYPAHDEYHGHTFTLEVVDLFMNSTTTWGGLVNDPDNYFIETDFGPVGIADGHIIGDWHPWTESIGGMVDAYNEAPRGFVRTTCRHDLLAKVRSVLHENETAFPEFSGMDYALQSLAVLTQERVCSELFQALDEMLPDAFEAKRKIQVIDEALEQLDAWTASDRVKLAAMFEILTPAVYTVTQFHSKVFNYATPVPITLSDKRLKRIRENIVETRNELLKNVSKRDRPDLERD